MKYTIEIEIADNQVSFAEEFFRTIRFIKKVTAIPANQITNTAILQSIEQYEKNETKPTALSLKELKDMLDA